MTITYERNISLPPYQNGSFAGILAYQGNIYALDRNTLTLLRLNNLLGLVAEGPADSAMPFSIRYPVILGGDVYYDGGGARGYEHTYNLTSLAKTGVGVVPSVVLGTDGLQYQCNLSHVSPLYNQPPTTTGWATLVSFLQSPSPGIWSSGVKYFAGHSTTGQIALAGKIYRAGGGFGEVGRINTSMGLEDRTTGYYSAGRIVTNGTHLYITDSPTPYRIVKLSSIFVELASVVTSYIEKIGVTNDVSSMVYAIGGSVLYEFSPDLILLNQISLPYSVTSATNLVVMNNGVVIVSSGTTLYQYSKGFTLQGSLDLGIGTIYELITDGTDLYGIAGTSQKTIFKATGLGGLGGGIGGSTDPLDAGGITSAEAFGSPTISMSDPVDWLAREVLTRALYLLGGKNVPDTAPYERLIKFEAKALLRDHPWNFAIRYATLTQLSGAPVFGYKYRYRLPADCLRVLKTDSEDTYSWRLEGREILTDALTLGIKYISGLTTPDMWDENFREAMVARVAMKLAPSISGNVELWRQMVKLYRQRIQEARASDAFESSIEMMDVKGLLDKR